MRNLTVKRGGSVAACAVAMRVYIEDPEGTDITVNGIPCRNLGELKNNSEDTYSISENEAKLYVIPEKEGSVYKSEYYQIPAGGEDVRVSGKNVLENEYGNPNPFRFDGVTNAAIERSKDRSRFKNILIVAIAVIVGLAIGLARTLLPLFNETSPKTFKVDNMEITLTKAFKKYDHKDYTANYNSKDLSVFVIKDSFADYPDVRNYTAEGYAELCADFYVAEKISQNVEKKTAEGLIYLSFDAEGEDTNTYHYYEFFFKTDDAFWIIEFSVDTDKAESSLPKIIEWAKTVKFS